MKKISRKIEKEITFNKKSTRFSLSLRFVVLGALIIIGWFLYNNFISSSESAVSYQTSKAEKGTLVIPISASGSVVSSNISSVTTQASGTVKKIYVKDGDKVIKGQKIAEIDLDQEGLQQQSSSYSSYVSALTSLTSANNNYRSTQASIEKLYEEIKGHDDDETLAVKETRTKAEVANDNAYESVKSAKAKISSAWSDYVLSSSTITSPGSGTVISLTITEGLTISSETTTSGTRTGQRIASIINDGNPIVSVSLSEIDVPNVKIGQKATLTFDSISDKTFSGEVVAVDRVGSISSNVTSYPVLIKLDSGSDLILPNMAVTANIITKIKENVLLVPSTSVSQQSGQTVVKVLQDGVVKTVNVEVGEVSDSQTEIISGIKEGEDVVTSSTASSGTSSGQTKSVFSSGFGGPRF